MTEAGHEQHDPPTEEWIGIVEGTDPDDRSKVWVRDVSSPTDLVVQYSKDEFPEELRDKIVGRQPFVHRYWEPATEEEVGRSEFVLIQPVARDLEEQQATSAAIRQAVKNAVVLEAGDVLYLS